MNGKPGLTFLQSLSPGEKQALLARAKLYFPGAEPDKASAAMFKSFKRAYAVNSGGKRATELSGGGSGSEQEPSAKAQSTEDVWETARLRVRAASLAAENDTLKMCVKELTERSAQLEGAIHSTEAQAQASTARTHKAAAGRVAEMEAEVDRYKRMLHELAASAEVLSKDNVVLSTEVMQLRERVRNDEGESAALQERIGQLQELYLRAMDSSNALASSKEMQVIAKLDELATPEVLAATRPPATFPVPCLQSAPDNLTAALSELDAARREAASLRQALEAAEQRAAERDAEVTQLRTLRKDEKLAYQQSAAKTQARLLGTMRRLVYVADQMAAKDAELKAREAYTHKLEQQLIQQHRDAPRPAVVRTVGAAANRSAQAEPPGWRENGASRRDGVAASQRSEQLRRAAARLRASRAGLSGAGPVDRGAESAAAERPRTGTDAGGPWQRPSSRPRAPSPLPRGADDWRGEGSWRDGGDGGERSPQTARGDRGRPATRSDRSEARTSTEEWPAALGTGVSLTRQAGKRAPGGIVRETRSSQLRALSVGARSRTPCGEQQPAPRSPAGVLQPSDAMPSPLTQPRSKTPRSDNGPRFAEDGVETPGSDAPQSRYARGQHWEHTIDNAAFNEWGGVAPGGLGSDADGSAGHAHGRHDAYVHGAGPPSDRHAVPRPHEPPRLSAEAPASSLGDPEAWDNYLAAIEEMEARLRALDPSIAKLESLGAQPPADGVADSAFAATSAAGQHDAAPSSAAWEQDSAASAQWDVTAGGRGDCAGEEDGSRRDSLLGQETAQPVPAAQSGERHREGPEMMEWDGPAGEDRCADDGPGSTDESSYARSGRFPRPAVVQDLAARGRPHEQRYAVLHSPDVGKAAFRIPQRPAQYSIADALMRNAQH